MNKDKLNTSIDKDYILMVLLVGEILTERIGDNAYNILVNSPFLDKLSDDPIDIIGRNPVYWAKWIIEWYDMNKD